MPPTRSVCGKDLPLDATFDFAIWRKQPKDLPIPDDMDLQERNQHNSDVQIANRASIRATRAYETMLNSGAVPPITVDIGPKLTSYYEYTEIEVEKMVTSVEFCERVVAPVPPKLLEFLLEERGKREKEAEKKKEEQKAKGTDLTGSMVMSNVAQINALTRPPVSIPDLFLAAIKHRMHPSLFWFTDQRLRYAIENPSEIPTKKNTSILTVPDKSLLDCAKLKSLWGSDDSAANVSVLTWNNALENFIAAIKILSAAPDNDNPFSFAVEMLKHRDFFQALEDFEALFMVWYPVEKRLRNKILTNNLAFDVVYWTSEAGGAINAWKAARAFSSGYYSLPLTKMADIGHFSGPPAYTPSAPKSQRMRDEDQRPYRDDQRSYRDDQRSYRDTPRRGDRESDNGWAGRDRFRDQGQDSFRERRPVHCLVCAGPHTLKNHPTGQVAFQDRQQCFATYEDGCLKTAKPHGGPDRRVICIGYNCNLGGRPCDGSDHPAERLHICSLCGGSHPALPGNTRCPRFRNGALVL
ncbi:hypothetical protein B0H15DRAFT_4746 [Mycena belliarum]|uniref:Uncharacterized protein n=1 Tax=Mycena belliarum TaxID=1033014 RepID=A0AAD6XZW8_9AGAR|nr:hypothetical protein B0H15DRAFT_4746 [Mycena belliae]